MTTQGGGRRLRGHLDNDVGGLAHDLGLEALLRIGRVGDRSNEAVRIDHRVAALDHVAFTTLLAVLVVGELVVFHIEAELVRGVLL